jgi:hypothetical protein
LHYPTPKTLRYSYFGQATDYIEYTLADHAIPGETPHQFPLGSLAVPGDYTVELTVAGQKYTQPLSLGMDPNVHVSNADLQAQHATEVLIAAQMSITYDATNELNKLKTEIDARRKQLPPSPEPPKSSKLILPAVGNGTAESEGRNLLAQHVSAGSADQKGVESRRDDTNIVLTEGNTPAPDPDSEEALEAPQRRGGAQQDEPKPSDPLAALDAAILKIRDGNQREQGFGAINRELARLAEMMSEGDARPAGALVEAVNQSCQELQKRSTEWKALSGSPSSPLESANIYLHDHNLAPLPALGAAPTPPACK